MESLFVPSCGMKPEVTSSDSTQMPTLARLVVSRRLYQGAYKDSATGCPTVRLLGAWRTVKGSEHSWKTKSARPRRQRQRGQ